MKNKNYKLPAILFYSVILALAMGLPNMAFATPLPDTGQTKCYNNTVEIPCPQQGEPFYGQDAQYGPNLQSFTDLGNGVVKDNITGLEWQQETAPGKYTWQQAVDYCNNLSLGGKDDWRLPTVKELSTLADSGISDTGPTINTYYFPGTQQGNYWSSTICGLSGGSRFLVGFPDSFLQATQGQGEFSVRAVRGGQPEAFDNLVVNGDGTVTDTATGLMWQQNTAPGIYTWEQALTYCENLTLGGHSDWRLPNRNELQSIVDYSRYTPAIDTAFFPDTVPQIYWTSTSYDSYGVAVDFYYGLVTGKQKTDSIYIRARAVRTTTIPPPQCAAEAIYGSNSEEIELLRDYRDKVLSKSETGRQIIKTYYELSPAVLEVLQKNNTARENARKVLDSLLPAIRAKVKQ
jgi:hypothetical protein